MSLVFLTHGNVALASESEAPVRNFNDVLTDLLNEFSYDLKTDQMPQSGAFAIRKVNLSQSIPETYEKYLESLITERVQSFGETRIVHCSTCRVKSSRVIGGRVVVTMPINNRRELDRLAREYSLDAWLDVSLIYQETAMILAFNLFHSKTKELLWSKVYNSEALYREYPSGVPDPEVNRDDLDEDTPRSFEDAEYVFTLGLGYALLPNVRTYSNMLALPMRFAEVFNEKRSEVGAQVVPLIDTTVFVPEVQADTEQLAGDENLAAPPEEEVIAPFKFGVGIFGNYTHNFVVGKSALDKVRTGLDLGLGFVAASGYLSFTTKIGAEIRMGRRIVLSGAALYSLPTTIDLGDGFTYQTQGGAGALASFGFIW